jgi:UPF0755 protein
MPKALRWFFRFISVVIGLGIFLFILILGGTAFFNAPPDKLSVSPDEAMRLDADGVLVLEVRNGETAYSVGRRLENAGIIKSRYFWNLLFRVRKDYIKTGTYRIEIPASQAAIRSILIAGGQILFRVTVPEGVTLKKAAQIFEDSGVCGAEEFLAASASGEILESYKIPGATMEGYLFPDTYLFPLAYPAPKVVSAMADNFLRRVSDFAPEALYMDRAELNKCVIVASIVEREYRLPDEAALMAGVFFNRLRIGMALQSCATVEYVITEIQGRPHPEVLYTRDLEIRDPYNTYQQPGLPPGPISAPGETALKAAFFPADSDYLYFRLIDADAGQHYFSRTLDDHNRAGVLYLKGR